MTTTKPVEGMTTKTVYSDYHIAVEIPEGYFLPKDPAEVHRRRVSDLEETARQIRRHIDGLDGVAVRYDATEVCGHCEYPIIDGYVDGEPACCNEAQAEYVALGNELS